MGFQSRPAPTGFGNSRLTTSDPSFLAGRERVIAGMRLAAVPEGMIFELPRNAVHFVGRCIIRPERSRGDAGEEAEPMYNFPMVVGTSA
jgi:hypothetical protein